MAAATTPRGRPDRQVWVGLAVAAAVAIGVVEIVLVVLISGVGMVVISNASVEWSTPPTDFCPYGYTTGGPPSVLEVRFGSVFNLSWGIGCEPYGPGNTTGGTYVISSVISSTWGYQVVSSNVPVVFGYDRVGYFNVSVRAPDWPADGSLVLTVEGGPLPAE
ncbi:MAG: hypothetical protein WCB18_09780 [Thermoplasmata archaeon]